MPTNPNPCVLVVHDDPAVAEELAIVMPDWHVGCTEHGDVAVDEAGAFDVVVVDLEREPVDGWFVLARLAPTGVDVVALAMPRHAARAIALGAHTVVTDAAHLAGALSAPTRAA